MMGRPLPRQSASNRPRSHLNALLEHRENSLTMMHNKEKGKEGTGREAKEKEMERIQNRRRGKRGKRQAEKERKEMVFTLR